MLIPIQVLVESADLLADIESADIHIVLYDFPGKMRQHKLDRDIPGETLVVNNQGLKPFGVNYLVTLAAHVRIRMIAQNTAVGTYRLDVLSQDRNLIFRWFDHVHLTLRLRLKPDRIRGLSPETGQ